MIKAVLFDWGNTLMKDFPDQKGPMYTWKKVEAIEHAEKCLMELSHEIPCYLVTNAKDSTKNEIYKALNMVNIGKYIKDIFCYNELGHLKPSTQYFKAILYKLSLKPDEIILVGDDLENDIKSAQKNGIIGILFDPYLKNTDFKPRIQNLLELKKFIKNYFITPPDKK
jgi:FMN phosphatase YigB (HAD superfamily)